MRYNYICYDCRNKLTESCQQSLGRDPTDEEILGSAESPGAVFETAHPINASEDEIYEATECPMCGGHNTDKTFLGTRIHAYTKGYGWEDRSGIRRDMNLHRLIHDESGDPYAEHRVPGEVDDLASRLRKGPQKKPQHFDVKPRKPD